MVSKIAGDNGKTKTAFSAENAAHKFAATLEERPHSVTSKDAMQRMTASHCSKTAMRGRRKKSKNTGKEMAMVTISMMLDTV